MNESHPILKDGLLDDRYEIRDTLGQGAFGTVYLALDRQLERGVAIKVIHGIPDWTDDLAHARSRLVREAQALSLLNHPSLVKVYRIGFANDQYPFIVMEFVDGEPLSAALARGGPFSSREATALCIQVAGALAHAHEHGVLHRDIKPGNILLERNSGEQRARLVDFGLVAINPGMRKNVTRLTVTGSFLGTPEYASPEQFRGEPADERADIYSLGLVYFEMLAGKPAFDEERREAVTKPLPDLLHADPSAQFPPLLQQVLNKATQKDKNERYETAGEFLSDLQTLLPQCGDRKFTTARLHSGQQRNFNKVGLAVGIGGAVAITTGLILATHLIEHRPLQQPPLEHVGANQPKSAEVEHSEKSEEADEFRVETAGYAGMFDSRKLVLSQLNRAVDSAIEKATNAATAQERSSLFDSAGALATRYLRQAQELRGQKYVCLATQKLARVYELTNRVDDGITYRLKADAEYKKYLSQRNIDEQDAYQCYRVSNLFAVSDDYLKLNLEESLKWLEEAERAARLYDIVDDGPVGLQDATAMYVRFEQLGDLFAKQGDIARAQNCYKQQKQFLSTQKDNREALSRVTQKIAELGKSPNPR